MCLISLHSFISNIITVVRRIDKYHDFFRSKTSNFIFKSDFLFKLDFKYFLRI